MDPLVSNEVLGREERFAAPVTLVLSLNATPVAVTAKLLVCVEIPSAAGTLKRNVFADVDDGLANRIV